MAEKRTHPDEYNNERDMAAFWAAAKPLREPAKQRWYIPLLLVAITISIPWYVKPGTIGTITGGLPGWVWVTLGCSVGASVLTAIAALIFWRDEDDRQK